jgi:Chitobiase/beta-hexosaminidase C-terminal domain/Immunoglobulin domain
MDETEITISPDGDDTIASPPVVVAMPTFNPAGGSGVEVTITNGGEGTKYYYTTDGTMPTQSSTEYTVPLNLTGRTTLRAIAEDSEGNLSAASVAYYGPAAASAAASVSRSEPDTTYPTAPVVKFTVSLESGANCVAVTELLPPGVGAESVSPGGNYLASQNKVVWGPFIGTVPSKLSYIAVGKPGVYPVRATWSVDGVSDGEMDETEITISPDGDDTIASPPVVVAMPTFNPTSGSSYDPDISPSGVEVTISSATAGAKIYYTTDGTEPTPTPRTTYSGPVTINDSSLTTVRAIAVDSGGNSSAESVAYYSPAAVPADAISVVPGVPASGRLFPQVQLVVTPDESVNCYAVIETIPYGLTPFGLTASGSPDGIWDPDSRTIRWGPFLDHEPRTFSFKARGDSGMYPLSARVSFNGYSVTSDEAIVEINENYSGSDSITVGACATEYLTYNVNIDPAPGYVTVTSASGTVEWGDGDSDTITQPVMTFTHSYSEAKTYEITMTANWAGESEGESINSGDEPASKTDTVIVVADCNAPQIVTQPETPSKYVLAGSTVLFTVSASSPVPLTYQWYYNDTFPIAGADSSVLTLPDIAEESTGDYSVVIANAFGSVTSDKAALKVITARASAKKTTGGSISLAVQTLPFGTVQIWGASSLRPPINWQLLDTLEADENGQCQFEDTNIAEYPAGYYTFTIP